MKYWNKLHELNTYSFLLKDGGVKKFKDSCGNWVDISDVQQVVSNADSRIFHLEMHLSNAREFAKVGRWDIVQNILESVENE